MTMLKKVSLLVLVLSVLLASTQAWKDMKDRLKNRIIHFETTSQRGHWLTASGKKDSAGSIILWVDQLSQRETYFTPKVQFQTKPCGGDKYLCLESLSQEHYYLAAVRIKNLKLQRVDSSPQLNDKEFHWTFMCEDDTMNKCKAIPIRFKDDGYLMVTTNSDRRATGHLTGTVDKDSADVLPRFWRIHAPNPTHKYVQLFQTENGGSVAQSAVYSSTVGISETRSTKHTITKSTAAEIGSAFKAVAGGGSLSKDKAWETFSSSKFESSKSVAHSLVIPPKTKVTLYQMVGDYDGRFQIGTDSYKTDEEKIDGSKSKRYQKRMFTRYFVKK